MKIWTCYLWGPRFRSQLRLLLSHWLLLSAQSSWTTWWTFSVLFLGFCRISLKILESPKVVTLLHQIREGLVTISLTSVSLTMKKSEYLYCHCKKYNEIRYSERESTGRANLLEITRALTVLCREGRQQSSPQPVEDLPWE